MRPGHTEIGHVNRCPELCASEGRAAVFFFASENRMEVLIPAAGAVVAAFIGSAATYLSLRWSKSGQIKSTEADVLWEESTSIRRELREQIQQLKEHLDQTEMEVAQLRKENAELKIEILTLRRENTELKAMTEALRQENVVLRDTQRELAKE